VLADLKLHPGDLPPYTRVLRFGVTPFLDEEAMRTYFGPVTQHLEEVLGLSVELVILRDYLEQIDAAVAGRIDIFSLSPLSYVLARERMPDLKLLATQLGQGASSYSSFVIVRADDPARGLTDLVGRRIAFVDRLSASGYLFPWAAFIDAGVDPVSAFSHSRFSGSHSQALADLVAGEVDAACTGSAPLVGSRVGWEKEGAAYRGGLRILHKAGRIPYDAICARVGMSRSGTDKIAAAFTSLSTREPRGRAVLSSALGISGWIPGEDSRYDSVRRVRVRVERSLLGRAPIPEQREPSPPDEALTTPPGAGQAPPPDASQAPPPGEEPTPPPDASQAPPPDEEPTPPPGAGQSPALEGDAP